jgi:nicotinamide riboside transporter PnuC
MRKLFAFLTTLFISISSNTASARCLTDECAEDRISAIFLFLPLTIWGFFAWAAFSQDTQLNDKKKNTTMKIAVCLAFIPVWWITSLLV